MIEHATVVEIKGDRAVVELERTAQCGHCRACLSTGGGKMRIELDTAPGISVGDRVEIEVAISRLKAVFTIFVLPLVAVLLGAVLGNYLTGVYFPDARHPNLLAILLALALVLLTYLGVYLYERKGRSQGSQPTIRRTG